MVLRLRECQAVHPAPRSRTGPLVRRRALGPEGQGPLAVGRVRRTPPAQALGDGLRRRPRQPGPAGHRPQPRRICNAVTAEGNNLAADAKLLRTAVLDNFATGGTNTGTKVFTPTKASKRQIEVHDKTGTRFGAQGTTVFASAANRYTDAYALKTTDGGALILFSHTHTQTDAVAHSGLQINPGKDDRAWLHDVPRTSIRYTFVCNDAATVPAKAEPSRLIGYTCARTDASGPPVPSWSDRA